MGKIKETIKDEVYDSYKEHLEHDVVSNNCSECHREARLISAHKTVNADWENLYPDETRSQSALRNRYGDNLPTGYVPE